MSQFTFEPCKLAVVDTREIRCLVAVAESLSFSQAAIRLHLSQQAVSRVIAAMETRWRIQLFVRHTRMVRRTDACEALLPTARAALEHIDRLRSEIAFARPERRRTLRLGGSISAWRLFMPSVMAELAARNVRIDWTELVSNDAEAALARGRLDAAFVHPPLLDANLVHEVLWLEPICAVLPARHRLARRRRLQLAELADERWVLYPREQGPALHDALLARLRRPNAPLDIVGLVMPHKARAEHALRNGAVTVIAKAAANELPADAVAVECEDVRLPLALAWKPDAAGQRVGWLLQAARAAATLHVVQEN
jgi:DNA-binding transcriptional LysR family regulator